MPERKVRFGSFAEVGTGIGDVRSDTASGHRQINRVGRKRATSGYAGLLKNYLVGFSSKDFINVSITGRASAINETGRGAIYEFAVQLDAIQFSSRFDGRCLRGEEFVYPDRPKGLPTLR